MSGASDRFDLAIIGAGAAGMFCAGVAARRGARVVLVDHAQRLGEKIRISGGGRCNFTNLQADRLERYLSADPRFARAALRAYPPARFVELVRAHRIGFHEKHRGQLFCDDSSERIIAMLEAEAQGGAVQWRAPCAVRSVSASERGASEASRARRFLLETDSGPIEAAALVVATGGLSIPKIGATDFGYRLARRFGLKVVEPRPALVPLTFDAQAWRAFAELAGVALEVGISAPAQTAAPRFLEDLLFTHRGLSGPAVLQISSFWRPGEPIEIDLAPGASLAAGLAQARAASRQQLSTVLAELLPRRLALAWLARQAPSTPRLRPDARIAELGNRDLDALCSSLQHWRLVPSGTEGFRKAEVTAGGVATEALDPRTMQARAVPGLYFIGEVVDVTGWLGGYNFQWAWASAFAAANAVTA
jgi:predicted Rossmann fold flavoprotein